MKKKMLWGIGSLVLIALISSLIYVSYGSNVRKTAALDYLEIKGYLEAEIQQIQVKHSFLSIVLGYEPWSIAVEFKNEPTIIYLYRYNSETGIRQSGISGGNVDTKKEDLLHLEK